AGIPVGDEAHGLNGPVLREQLPDLTLSGRKRKVSDVDLRHAIKLQETDKTWPRTIRLFSDSEASPECKAGGRRQERERSRTGRAARYLGHGKDTSRVAGSTSRPRERPWTRLVTAVGARSTVTGQDLS